LTEVITLQISNLFHRKLQINCYYPKALFSAQNAPETIAGRALTGSTHGEAYSTPLDSPAGLRGWSPREGEVRGEGTGERGG